MLLMATIQRLMYLIMVLCGAGGDINVVIKMVYIYGKGDGGRLMTKALLMLRMR